MPHGAQLAPDVDQQKLPSVNQPDSGTFGEKADLARLQASLPETDAEAAPQVDPSTPTGTDQPVTNTRSNREATNLPGVPAPLLRPSDRPGQSVNTPLDAGGSTAAVSPSQQRLAMMDALASSPHVHEDTREWAKLVIRILTE